jgi:hypothetical protein
MMRLEKRGYISSRLMELAREMDLEYGPEGSGVGEGPVMVGDEGDLLVGHGQGHGPPIAPSQLGRLGDEDSGQESGSHGVQGPSPVQLQLQLQRLPVEQARIAFKEPPARKGSREFA